MMDHNKLVIDQNQIKKWYRWGMIGQGRFKRAAKALGMLPAEVQSFVRRFKSEHKEARRSGMGS
jgi:hypothetical protein